MNLAVFWGGVNIHVAPDVNSQTLHQTHTPDFGHIFGVSAIRDADGYQWVHVEFEDGRPAGWGRCDKIGAAGDLTLLGGGVYTAVVNLHSEASFATPPAQTPANGPSSPATPLNPPAPVIVPVSPVAGDDRLAAPVAGPITQPFGWNGSTGHKGTDIGAAKGDPVNLPIYNRLAGVVVQRVTCGKCANGDGSLRENGNPPAESTFNDLAWGYGFGNFITVQYKFADLPASMRAWMKANGADGYYAYVVHGHQSELDAGVGSIAAGVVIGRRGASGNTTGPHLHVEIHLSPHSNDSNYFAGTDGRKIVNPNLLFKV